MNREDIIRMAREVGLLPDNSHPAPQTRHMTEKQACIERFAALVSAAEREKVARWQIGSGYSTGHGDTIEDLLVELEWQVRESEREAIAQMIEDAPALVSFVQNDKGGCLACGFTPKLAANSIRTRGQK